jgi:hypothetical protein
MLRVIGGAGFVLERSLHKARILRERANAGEKKYQNERLELGHWQ